MNLVLAAFALSGCAAVGPNFERPAAIVSPQFKEIKGWKIATPRESEPKGAWWSVFHDPELDQLMPDRRRVQPDGQGGRSQLSRGAGAHQRGPRRALSDRPGERLGDAARPKSGTQLTAEASGTWTLDIWGQVRREVEAQQAGAEVSAATLANATLSEQSLLAHAYVTLREADLLEDLLEKTVIEYKHSLSITQNQYNAGTAAKSDVITAETQVLNAQAQLIAAGVSRAQSEHAIAVLMGRPPAGLSIPRGSLATRVPSVPVGLPSSLLERRPDVAAAEETMRQANAEIGVAFAGYFPAVSLNGLVGYSGNPFAAAFGPTNPVWSFGASLAQPLFNGGLTTAQVEAARQTYQADVATYRQTVLTAIQQVEDALAGIRILFARGQGAGRKRAHLPAGDADHAQRISGRDAGLHRGRHRRSPAALGRGSSALDPGAGPDRRGRPSSLRSAAAGPIETARRRGADIGHSAALRGRALAAPIDRRAGRGRKSLDQGGTKAGPR